MDSIPTAISIATFFAPLITLKGLGYEVNVLHNLANSEEVRHLIINGYDHLLVAETSCNFFWGSRFVHRAFDDLEKAYSFLDTAVAIISGNAKQNHTTH